MFYIYVCEKSSSCSMNVQRFPRAFWDHVQPAVHDSTTTFAPVSVCKRSLRSIASKMSDNNNNNNTNESFSFLASYDLKSFIRPESGPRRPSPASYNSVHISSFTKADKNAQMETSMHPGGTRWNPTQEQIGILEMLYKGGMRTPNTNEIEQIAEKLAKFGKTEGKNVFYWFQNHKARERQRQKRERIASYNKYHHPISLSSPSSTELNSDRITITSLLNSDNAVKEDFHVAGVCEGAQKRRCRSWNSAVKESYEKECKDDMKNRPCRSDDEVSVCRTLLLFPLHPEEEKKDELVRIGRG